MTDKEKEAIKEFDRLIKLRKNKAGEIKFDTCIVSTAQLEIVLTLIQTEQVEIKEYKKIIAQDNKEYEHMKKSLKGIISRSNAEIEKKDIELIETKEANRQLSLELQKKDKIINLMVDHIMSFYRSDVIEDWFDNRVCSVMKKSKTIADCVEYVCEDCIKQYFERKVETEEK